MSLTSAAEAERQADRLRRDLFGTLDQLVDNLMPVHLAAEAMAVTRAHMPAWLARCWTLARSPAGLAVISGTAAIGLAGLLKARRGGKRRGADPM